MSTAIFILRGLRHHWRLHAAAAAGVAVATTVLAGALMLGDSVRFSLERRQLLRLGRTGLALSLDDRFFRSALADGIADDAAADAAPLLTVPGVVMAAASERRINRANVVGIDARFLALAERPEVSGLTPMPGEALINAQAARRLGVAVGDELVVRIGRHGWLPLDSPFVAAEAPAKALRVRVKVILAAESLGDFDLRTSQSVPANVFVHREELATVLGLPDRANAACFAGKSEIRNTKFPTTNSARSQDGRSGRDALSAALIRQWQLADVGLDVIELPDAAGCELRSARIFLTPAEEAAARAAHPAATGVLGYLVNEIQAGDRSTPYSFVAGLEGGSVVPADLAMDEVVVNQWLADDLRIVPGDRVTLRYFVIGERRELREAAAEFRVRAILPLAGAAADPTLAPLFPGLTDVGNCRDWDADVSIDTGRIRDQDEAYWEAHHGTPKAFVGLETARRMWANRYGGLTAVRYPAGTDLAAVTAGLREKLTPESFGLRLEPVRAEALQAARSGVDFGQLFLGLSMFLLASAWLLAALLFGFGIENRAVEVGLLRALGFSRRETGILLLVEGMMPALLGAMVGGAGGVLYNLLLIHGLRGAWQGAAGGAEMIAKFAPVTIATGIALGFAAAVMGMAWMLFRQLRRSAVSLQAESGSGVPPLVTNVQPRGFGHGGCWPVVVALLLLGAALTVALVVSPERGPAVAGAFFLSGTLLLSALLLLAWVGLLRLGRSPDAVAAQGGAHRVNLGTPSIRLAGWSDDADPTVGVPRGTFRTEGANAAITSAQLPVRNAARRPGRSLTVLALTAAGIFLVVAVAANRRNPGRGVGERRSGTGGFALYGETAIPWFEDLNGERAQGRLGLSAAEGCSWVQIKVCDGDDASCLNLNRVTQPRLLGVDPEDFRRRGAFAFAALTPGVDPADPWSALTQPLPDGVVPAFADQSVIQWGLGKRLGDELSYVDEHGGELRLRLVGALVDSVFQGNVLVAQSTFSRHFPSNNGFRVMLVDLPPGSDVANFATGLSRALRDLGPELTSTPDRLSTFQSVENTYLSAFLLLGGLGVLLGAAGVGVVLLRNALERRGELALLRAIGFSRAERFHQLLAEHAGLLAAGVVLGLLAGLLAVLPAMRTASERIPWGLLAALTTGILLHGLAWTAIAAGYATCSAPRDASEP